MTAALNLDDLYCSEKPISIKNMQQ